MKHVGLKLILGFTLFTHCLFTHLPAFGQTEMSEEKFYLWSLKRYIDTKPEERATSLKNAVNGYGSYWDRENYKNSKSNEFAKQDYADKIFNLINSKIQLLDYKTNYYYVSKDQLLDYDFNTGTFSTTGAKMFAYKHFTSISFSSENTDNFLALKFAFPRDKAKDLLASKTRTSQTDRTVYKKIYFKVLPYDIYGVTISVSKVEVFGDEGLIKKLVEVQIPPKKEFKISEPDASGNRVIQENIIVDKDFQPINSLEFNKRFTLKKDEKSLPFRIDPDFNYDFKVEDFFQGARIYNVMYPKIYMDNSGNNISKSQDIISGIYRILASTDCNITVLRTPLNNQSDASANNKPSSNVVQTESGLRYEIIRKGYGKIPLNTNIVSVHYVGTLLNGKEFDNSYKRGEPLTIVVSQLIPGWTEALRLMPVGSKWKLIIPPNLAYGENGAGADIPGGATLIFEVELLSIEN